MADRRSTHLLGVLRAGLRLVLWSWIPPWLCTQINTRTAPLRRWAWATRPRRIVLRAAAAWYGAGLLLMMCTGSAYADNGGSSSPPALSWMDIQDTHGINVWSYNMSIDHGSAMHPLNVAWAFMIEMEWQFYRSLIGFAIWFITWALKFDWLQTLVTPVREVASAVTDMTDRFGATPMFLTVAATTAVVWMARGKWSTGIYELFVSCLVAALAVGVLSNPVERVAGPDGLIMHAHDAGLQIAAGLVNKGNDQADPNTIVTQISGSLADTFLRQPTQMLNFGRVIDGQKCESAWDQALRDPKHDENTLKDTIDKCECGGGPMKDYADNPGPGQAISGAMLIPGGAVVLLFGVMLAFAMLLAAASALGNSVRGIPVLVIGLLPGRARGSLWHTAASVAMALVIMMFSIVFTAGYMLVARGVFATAGGDSLMRKFVIVDIVLLIGVVLFRRGIKALKTLSHSLAQALGNRPGAKPTAVTKPGSYRESLGRGMNKGVHAAQQGRRAYQTAKLTRQIGQLATGAATGGTSTALIGAAGAAAAAKKKAAGAAWRQATERTVSVPKDLPQHRTGTPADPVDLPQHRTGTPADPVDLTKDAAADVAPAPGTATHPDPLIAPAAYETGDSPQHQATVEADHSAAAVLLHKRINRDRRGTDAALSRPIPHLGDSSTTPRAARQPASAGVAGETRQRLLQRGTSTVKAPWGEPFTQSRGPDGALWLPSFKTPPTTRPTPTRPANTPPPAAPNTRSPAPAPAPAPPRVTPVPAGAAPVPTRSAPTHPPTGAGPLPPRPQHSPASASTVAPPPAHAERPPNTPPKVDAAAARALRTELAARRAGTPPRRRRRS